LDQPKLFGRINKGTIQKWIDKETKHGWSKATVKNVKRRHALAGTGQTGILAKYPDIVSEITTQLRGLRTSGVAVNVLIARSIMLAIIKAKKPELLVDFKCSEVMLASFFLIFYHLSLFQSYVRSFLESKMNWTPRKGTRAAAHLPPDADDKIEEKNFRQVYAMKWHDIPTKVADKSLLPNSADSLQLIINFDQMGIYILPNGNSTLHDRGANQVDTAAKDEKRAYTLLVASTPNGDFLLFQQVWAGASDKSLPSPNAAQIRAEHRTPYMAYIRCPYYGSHPRTIEAIRVPTIQPFLYGLCMGQSNLARISFISVSRCLPLQFCCINIVSIHNWWHRRRISRIYGSGMVRVRVSTVPVPARSFPYTVDGRKMYSHTCIRVRCSAPAQMQEAIDHGFNFAYTKSEKKTSHFSTFKTMKEVSNLRWQ
jgi:hypothetical protein